MRISDGIDEAAVVVRPRWTTFAEVVDGLVACIAENGRIPRALARQATASICEREIISSTAMVDIGVSIPHARIEGIDGIVAALAVSPDGVYQVADGVPIGIVALVLSSPRLAGEHLNFLSSLSLLLQSDAMRRRLRNAANAAEVVRLVRENESQRG